MPLLFCAASFYILDRKARKKEVFKKAGKQVRLRRQASEAGGMSGARAVSSTDVSPQESGSGTPEYWMVTCELGQRFTSLHVESTKCTRIHFWL